MPKGSKQDDEQTNSFRTSSVTLSDSAKGRLTGSVEKRLEKERTAKVSRWEQFKAVITNKDVKTTVKNVGKGYKAITDAVAKTGDPDKLSSTAQGFGQSGTVVGGVTQLFETGVDIYLAKQKVDKAKRDLQTVEKGGLQKLREESLEKQVAEQLKETNKAKRSLRTSERVLQKHNDTLQQTRDTLGAKEKDIEHIEGQLRALEENLRPISRESGVSTGFLEQVQSRLVKDLSSADAALGKLEQDWDTRATPLVEEISKIEGQLRVLEENIQDAPGIGVGTDVYEGEKRRLNEKLSVAQSKLAKVQEELDPQIARKKEEISNIEGKLRDIDDNIRSLKPESTQISGTSFFMEQRDKLKNDLTAAKSERRQLKKDIEGLEDDGRKLELRVQKKKATYQTERKELKKLRTELGESLSTDKLKMRMAQKDLNQYNDDVPLERAKLVKSLLDGESATANLISVASSGASTVVSEGAKLAGGMVGVVVGPLTAVVNTVDLVNDHKGRMTALNLKHKASDALAQKDGIKQDDAELLAIAERLRLKQKKTSVDKGLSATKNFFGAAGGIGTAAAGAATIATIVGAGVAAAGAAAAVLTPVGWALAGAAAAAAIGYGIYKLVRHVNSQAIKEALKETISLTNKEDGNTKLGELEGLSKKQQKALDKVAEKCLAALKKEDPTLDLKKEDLTMDQLNSYACKKLLARDTGIATEALLERFKTEVKAHLGDKPVTKEAMEQYLKTESQKVPVDSAVGLMAKLGVGLKAEEAVDLYRDKSQSDAIKFLSKKIYSPTKEAPSQEENLSQGMKGAKVTVDKSGSQERSVDSPKKDEVSVERDDSQLKVDKTNSVRSKMTSSEKAPSKTDLGIEDSHDVGMGTKSSNKLRDSLGSSKSEKVGSEGPKNPRTSVSKV
ncbi:hypothetical protein DES53_102573 [Roseimicrobium gellanilyticum]|uniref:Uncharacterized protein n=1 Tax=Roseimicrobium gellanilyticum TaxID=748857 RepID=A0A366HU07_9BACT|nr:hypothetical protein [Roseimicrobium gellanilyticum]RBP46187.1 hypothetical protein DES53_102573 [Roseimicrobium gellanilyticum]